MGLVSSYEERGGAGQPAIHKKDFTWTQDAAGNPYTSAVLTTLDPGQSYQKQSKLEQTLNVYGSVTQSKIYDFGNLVTPARTYTHTYLTGTNYTSRYINNRLTQSQVTNGTTTITLVTNTYDGAYTQTPLGSLYGHHDTANYGTGLLYRGNVTRHTQQGAYTDFRYDYTGTTKTATDNLGYSQAVTPAAYSNNDVPGVITPNSNTNLNTSLTYSAFFGVTSETAPNASTSSLSYDGYARPSSSASPHGASTTYTYTNSPPTTKATTNGRWVKTTMDGLGRTIKVETADSTNTVLSVVDTEYDSCACSPLGKVKRVSQPYAPGATVYWTTNTYDALGRTVSVSLPNGTGTTTYLYQGNTTKVTDPAGKWKTYTTDAMGNLTKVTEPNPAGGADLDSNYTYNLFNRLTQTSMTRSSTTQTRTFNYDNTTHRLMSVAHPESGTVAYTYNADGTVATKVDAKNQKIAYTYDSYKRVTQIQRYPVSTGAEDVCQRVYFWYDTDKHDPNNVYGFQLQNG